MRTLPRTILSVVAAATCAISAHAQSITTDPVGFININVAPGTGTTKVVSVLSFPLLGTDPNIVGQSVGYISGITANTITNSNAGWTAGALSVASNPYLIQITSGQAKGRVFVISTVTQNSAVSVTIDSEDAGKVDLTTLGIAAGASGDTYAIYQCDTIASIFGTPATTGVLGSTSATNADNVQLLVNGGWRSYYYSTTQNQWLRTGIDAPSNSVFIRPDSGVIYSRLANSALILTLIGKVPVINRQAAIANSGVTFIANSWPTDLTLGTSGFTSIPGWVSSPDSSIADVAQMFVSGGWRKYYNDGTGWKIVGIGAPSDSVAIPAGTSVIISKKGSTSGYSTFSQNIPYTL